MLSAAAPCGCPLPAVTAQPFFQNMHRALRPGGVVCTQGECLWLHLDLIKEVTDMSREVFVGGTVAYAFTTIPTYPSGQIGFVLCAKQGDATDFVTPQRPPPAGGGLRPLRYYNPQVHRAAFALPEFARSALAGSLTTAV